jgi:hypothetical protein
LFDTSARISLPHEGPISRSGLPLQSDSGEEALAQGLRWRIQNPPAALLGQSEAWHRILGDISTQPVLQLRFSAKGTCSGFVPIPLVPTKALIGLCKRNSFKAVPPKRQLEKGLTASFARGNQETRLVEMTIFDGKVIYQR